MIATEYSDPRPHEPRGHDTLANDDPPPRRRWSWLPTGGRQLLIAVRVMVTLTVILGIAYPAVVLGIGRLMPTASDGSWVKDSAGRVVGSALIGQQFEGDQWFIGRPSAAGDGYDAMSSGGSNLAANSPKLTAEIEQRRAEIAASNGVDPSQVPADAVTASASGLDPDISPAYAEIQVRRVATARHLSEVTVRQLVTDNTSGRSLGFLGEPRVNVLRVNLALEELSDQR
ncbi:potassium-transporting ATPase subunit KdpC [Nakamurella lactea]|uniref:potassium-transporting ATPase subunit KdpC n=1 Tax=Nakamurella lactea TaxID=459515 RepID=UPI0004125E02|nr:potassium-transporting ATPase subunit KdpC [Nakamurella lactea]